jgi:hypothetical protein
MRANPSLFGSGIAGCRVHIVQDKPKMQLAPGDYVTPEYKKYVDQWLVEFFGTTNIIADGQMMVFNANNLAIMPGPYTEQVVMINPRTAAVLKNVKE